MNHVYIIAYHTLLNNTMLIANSYRILNEVSFNTNISEPNWSSKHVLIKKTHWINERYSLEQRKYIYQGYLETIATWESTS